MKKKIAIPSIGEMLNAHFGRAQTFKVFEITDGKVLGEQVINSTGYEHQHEGIALLLKYHGVQTVICGGIGAGAIAGLEAAGINVLRGASGRVKDVAQAYADGTLIGTDDICDHSPENANHHVECVCDD